MSYTIELPPDDGTYPVISAATDGVVPAKVDYDEVKSLFMDYGVVLFRNFSFGQSELNALTSQYCSGFVMNKQPNRQQISGDGRTQSVNLDPSAFPLHPEMSQVPWRPDIAWFACAQPPKSGGETTLCDGLKIVDGMRGETREYLSGRLFLYKKRALPEECKFWAGVSDPSEESLKRQRVDSPFKFVIEGGVLFKLFLTPALYQPMFSNRLAFGSFLLFRRLLHNKKNFPLFEDGSIVPEGVFNEIKMVSDRYTVNHQWVKNDILMVDNTRFMHGRRAIDDLNERRIATQFGFASFRCDIDNLGKSQPWRCDPSMLMLDIFKL